MAKTYKRTASPPAYHRCAVEAAASALKELRRQPNPAK
jgi:hypothetical protein